MSCLVDQRSVSIVYRECDSRQRLRQRGLQIDLTTLYGAMVLKEMGEREEGGKK